jgi:choline-phosphate cytidylyltransferase
MVGVFSDGLCPQVRVPHVERCECVRHCRWVDQVIEDAPWTVDDTFMGAQRIDYVAVEEGASVDPEYSMVRVNAYDALKSQGALFLGFLS